ncbi:RsmB/NOP family class I SAM-dependent RNA methyltransferase [Paenibacillus cucumis (ex Kampfer et al. 2016)]|uniref:RsmF rRNA methyltransferase first C-terminal domain-containing protein n=1 Tax=Paenibacillus cucumis (ex Kampfer et al. 2016) TaxID=1776858 RepID=A0ABS7KD73_9BACL|nr:RsmB/NOP family class I SAM-dependent RNA methyltransferase [Paenibacillus cucumis (ex Kampfer et al. 2016)]MBY0201897.1 RsmF rRNA methyltransferase first C-terminal domain-containing protein [Paenibacillus cucumis (ex Kampfer et al. 2016)]
MAVQLPLDFAERMKRLLGDEFESFIQSYEQSPHAGLRINTLKISMEQFKEIAPFDLRPIPWCETGFYVPHGVKPGLHPYYHAGLYYIQEPSAMAPVEQLNVQPGDRVLDLCAAPGGKSTQIAAKLQGKGVLVTNDIHSERTKALAKNVELYGVRNAVVLNESPERIADAFPHYFDKVLIDAPCSGEGMFRKDEDMVKSWEHHSVEKCVLMQRDILETAARLLAPGGTIVYSTCTFAPEENEAMIAEFLKLNRDFAVVNIADTAGFAPGRPDWVREMLPDQATETEEVLDQTRGTARLWPHLLEGEGHYVAVIKHSDESNLELDKELHEEKRGAGQRVPESRLLHEPSEDRSFLRSASLPITKADRKKERLLRVESRASNDKSTRGGKHTAKPGKKGKEAGGRKSDRGQGRASDSSSVDPLAVYAQFVNENLVIPLEGETVCYGDRVYQSTVGAARLEGLKVIRPGWFMGTVKNGRFVPSHPLACALRASEAHRSVHLSSEDGEAVRYLKGETLNIEQERLNLLEGAAPKGYVLVCVDGYAAGWGKWLDGVLKNEYPAGWRWTSV